MIDVLFEIDAKYNTKMLCVALSITDTFHMHQFSGWVRNSASNGSLKSPALEIVPWESSDTDPLDHGPRSLENLHARAYGNPAMKR